MLGIALAPFRYVRRCRNEGEIMATKAWNMELAGKTHYVVAHTRYRAQAGM